VPRRRQGSRGTAPTPGRTRSAPARGDPSPGVSPRAPVITAPVTQPTVILTTWPTAILPATARSTIGPVTSRSQPDAFPESASLAPLDPGVSFLPWKLIPCELPNPPRYSKTVLHKGIQTENPVGERGTQTSHQASTPKIARIAIEIQAEDQEVAPVSPGPSTPRGRPRTPGRKAKKRSKRKEKKLLELFGSSPSPSPPGKEHHKSLFSGRLKRLCGAFSLCRYPKQIETYVGIVSLTERNARNLTDTYTNTHSD